MKNQKGNMGLIVSVIITIIVIGFVVYILVNKDKQVPPAPTENNISENQANDNINNVTEQVEPTQKNMENTKILSNFTPTAKISSLEKIDLVVGNGKEVKAGATVSVHYTGAVASTGVIFQSSKDFGPNPVTFPLSGVIKGWTDGIPGMKVGGTRRLMIPSDQAYGATPPPGSGIPANADLVFDVELVGIE